MEAIKLDHNTAFKLDADCRAYIKCTYVNLYNAAGTRLFSLQEEKFGQRPLGEIHKVGVDFLSLSREEQQTALTPVTISKDLESVLTSYVNDIVKKEKDVKEHIKCLLEHFEPVTLGRKISLYRLRDKVFYLRPSACWWETVNVTATRPVVTEGEDGVEIRSDQPKPALSKKSKAALLMAAALALFNN